MVMVSRFRATWERFIRARRAARASREAAYLERLRQTSVEAERREKEYRDSRRAFLEPRCAAYVEHRERVYQHFFETGVEESPADKKRARRLARRATGFWSRDIYEAEFAELSKEAFERVRDRWWSNANAELDRLCAELGYSRTALLSVGNGQEPTLSSMRGALARARVDLAAQKEREREAEGVLRQREAEAAAAMARVRRKMEPKIWDLVFLSHSLAERRKCVETHDHGLNVIERRAFLEILAEFEALAMKAGDCVYRSHHWSALRRKFYDRWGESPKCLKCGCQRRKNKNGRWSGYKVVPDHVVSIRTNPDRCWSLENLQPLCSKCNREKGNKTMDYKEVGRKAAEGGT